MIAIAVDSGLDIPKTLLDQYGIVEIPVHLYWQGRQYRDKVDLDVEEMFAQGRGSKDFPTTSQPSPGEFAAAYRRIAEKAKTIRHTLSTLTAPSAQAGAKWWARTLRFDTRSVAGVACTGRCRNPGGGNIREAKAAASVRRRSASV